MNNRIIEIPNSGSSSNLEYQTEITTSTTLTTEKELNKVYPVNSPSAVVITVPEGVYVENDVINFERRGQGTVEFVRENDNVFLKGVRDINNRYFINDRFSWVSLICRGSNEWSVVGRLTDGYTGAVTTSSYTSLAEGDINKDVTVIGTGFSDNMIVTVSANATLNSFTVVSNLEVTLNLTAVGVENDTVTVTYDNGDIFVDTNAITIIAPVVPVPVANIVSYWNFDGQVNDQVGSNNGSVTGSITYLTGLVGSAGNFTSGDEISVADSNDLSFNPNNPFSYSLWVYQTGFNDGANICFYFSKRDGSGAEYQLFHQGSSFGTSIFSASGTSDSLAVQSGEAVNFNTWQHLCVTYDGSATVAGLKLYVDGVNNDTDNSIGTYVSMNNTTAPLLLGGATWSTNTFSLLGRMDEVVLFNKELSADEVNAVRQKGLNGQAVNS